MSKRDKYKVLAEKYDTLYEVREVKQVPFSQDELKVLTALYNFKTVEGRPAKVHRIATPGYVENVLKYSDNSFVLMIDDARNITKKEFQSFYELVQHLSQPYKADTELSQKQTPSGQDMPYGRSAGGQS